MDTASIDNIPFFDGFVAGATDDGTIVETAKRVDGLFILQVNRRKMLNRVESRPNTITLLGIYRFNAAIVTLRQAKQSIPKYKVSENHI